MPQSTPTGEACIIIEEPAWVNQFNGNQPRILSVYSQDASTQCFVITRSEYTQTDSVASPVPQLVKTFTNAGTQVKLITESPDGTNTGPSSHSSHLKDEKKKIGGIYTDCRPVDCDKSDKKKKEPEENIDSDSKPKKLTLFEQVYPSDAESPNDPPLSPLAANDDDDDEEYASEMTDSAGSSSDDTDYELDS